MLKKKKKGRVVQQTWALLWIVPSAYLAVQQP